MKVAIMTDSNSGITQKEAKELGIFVLPMPFTIDGQEFEEDINLSQEEFYDKLMNGAEVFTSQPAAGEVTNFFNNILKDYDQIVHIPMSSGLSGSCQTAMMLAEEEEYKNKVYVVDSQRISVTQKYDVLDALELAKQGKDAKEIHDILMENKLNATIYITVNTLEYLKKGGRITPAAAALGGLLKIKPILTIQGEKLDSFQKTRTMAKATKIMINATLEDIKTRIDPTHEDMSGARIMIAYTYDKEQALELKKQAEETFPHHEIICDPLSLSVACHIGPHSLAVAACKKII
ncbi:DegV family protein [Candidatus Stoquefichus sp. SB1]|uniref:DegV family protein n=1 Tax=Candidatus Stoquefichus sp. SB1 TaxID=1658109 RepID=UPI00067ED7A0|nr:DegV family protein [Candidatus Stoquefichus sp. SB1]